MVHGETMMLEFSDTEVRMLMRSGGTAFSCETHCFASSVSLCPLWLKKLFFRVLRVLCGGICRLLESNSRAEAQGVR